MASGGPADSAARAGSRRHPPGSRRTSLAIIAVGRFAPMPGGLEARWRRAEQHDCPAGTGIAVPVELTRRVRDGVALLEQVRLIADPELEAALEDDHDLLVRLVRIGFVARSAAGFDRREDHLEPAITAEREELVDRVQAGVCDPAPLRRADDTAERDLVDEQLGNSEVEGAGDPLDGGDRGARHLALDLGQEALRHAGSLGELAKRDAAGLAERPDPRTELELRRRHPLPPHAAGLKAG